jgi:hypothetical protein
VATAVLGRAGLNGKVVTAGALHTVKATANYIHQHGNEFILPVKENRRALSGAAGALPWEQAPIAHTAAGKGHGRITTRTIQVLPAPEGLPFPHVSQVFLIERYVTGLHGQPVSAVAALGVASPESGQADAAAIAGYVREQWPVESLHWRHLVSRGQIAGQNQIRTKGHGGPEKPGHLRYPTLRPRRRHRSHPVGQPGHGPSLHHPPPHIMILERPCPLSWPVHLQCSGHRCSTLTGCRAEGRQ